MLKQFMFAIFLENHSLPENQKALLPLLARRQKHQSRTVTAKTMLPDCATHKIQNRTENDERQILETPWNQVLRVSDVTVSIYFGVRRYPLLRTDF